MKKRKRVNDLQGLFPPVWRQHFGPACPDPSLTVYVGGLGLTLISTGTLSVFWPGPNLDPSKPPLLPLPLTENLPKHTGPADSVSVPSTRCAVKIQKLQPLTASCSLCDSDAVYKNNCLFILTPFREQTFLRLRHLRNKQPYSDRQVVCSHTAVINHRRRVGQEVERLVVAGGLLV